MRKFITSIAVLITVTAALNIGVSFTPFSITLSNHYRGIDVCYVEVGRWAGSLFFIETQDTIINWDFLYLNSSTMRPKG